MQDRTDSVTELVDSRVNTDADRISAETYKTRALRWVVSAFVFAVFLLLVCMVQRRAGAQVAAFGGFPDECAHYIGGLAMHDYVSKPLGQDPISFVRGYH